MVTALFIYLVSCLTGLALGSFANVCILRLPSSESLWFPRSRCPNCQSPIGALDNIPVVSYLILGGHCRSCGHPISRQYPIVELSMMLLFLINAIYFRYNLSTMIVTDIFGFYLLTISIIDYQHRIIPDELSLSLLLFGVGFSFLNPSLGNPGWHALLQSLLSAFGGGLIMLSLAWTGEKIFRKEALGGGDIKLIAAVGAIAGWPGVLGSLFIGSLVGALFALALLLMKKKKRGDTLPFGPFLSLGAYIVCFLPKGWMPFIFS